MESPFSKATSFHPLDTVVHGGRALATKFGTAEAEYRAATEHAAVFDRSDRGLIRVTGKDRQSWLHNLVTNAVKALAPGDGVYAFAIDVRGRIQFDLNILAFPDFLWLDIDAAAVPVALKHFDRYLISEDVKLQDQTADFARLGFCGPQSADIAAALGVANPTGMPLLKQHEIARGVQLVRSGFSGMLGFECICPLPTAPETWDSICNYPGVAPVGFSTLDVLRIEAGIPWLGRDLDEKVIPPETGTMARSISYNKGCYLGQEVIERMRSHGALPRRLVRLECAEGPDVGLPAPIRRDGVDVGRVTSMVRHPVRGVRIGLGYLKSAVSDSAGLTFGDPPLSLTFREVAAAPGQ